MLFLKIRGKTIDCDECHLEIFACNIVKRIIGIKRAETDTLLSRAVVNCSGFVNSIGSVANTQLCNHSPKGSHRKYVNKRVWLDSEKPSLRDMEISMSIFICHKILLFYLDSFFPPTI